MNDNFYCQAVHKFGVKFPFFEYHVDQLPPSEHFSQPFEIRAFVRLVPEGLMRAGIAAEV
jgi:hypothetical protein